MKKGVKENEKSIKIICEWKLDLEDDMLHSLLLFFLEDLALEYMGFYRKFLKVELFLFALNNGNMTFM